MSILAKSWTKSSLFMRVAQPWQKYKKPYRPGSKLKGSLSGTSQYAAAQSSGIRQARKTICGREMVLHIRRFTYVWRPFEGNQENALPVKQQKAVLSGRT